MPTYEYRCANGHDFEKFFRTISASQPEVPCPQCGAVGVRQLSAGAGLLFKGSGFYLTDYGKNAHATRGDARATTSGSEGTKPASDAGSGASGAGAGKAASAGGTESSASTGATSGADKRTPKKGD